MSDLPRRDLLIGLAALGVSTVVSAQQPTPAAGTFGPSRVLDPDDHLTPGPKGAQHWSGPKGTTPDGEVLGMHVSIVPAGTPASAPHRSEQTEIIVVQQGTLEYIHDGVTERAPAGSIVYVALGTNHLVRNAGPNTARYTVLQIGGDTKKS